ncbi:unnamed protein product [Pedinophyceae sp. YPF-701]|nr:unnamed protein product [Pedinophyceae sp. YPF-701]
MRASSESGKTGVLFVCLGNICRSPTAEAVFNMVVERAGVADSFDIDSCGTGGGNPGWYKEGGWSYHEGDPADSRMKAAAQPRNVCLTSISRPLKPEDFSRFDYIIGMDDSNMRAISTAAEYWASSAKLGKDMPPLDECMSKVRLMTKYCRDNKGAQSVPDPYYGGPQGFEVVLDLLEDACEGLLADINAGKA